MNHQLALAIIYLRVLHLKIYFHQWLFCFFKSLSWHSRFDSIFYLTVGETMCEAGTTFRECANACGVSCGSLQTSELCSEQCVPGCTCPNNMVKIRVKKNYRLNFIFHFLHFPRSLTTMEIVSPLLNVLAYTKNFSMTRERPECKIATFGMILFRYFQ